METDRGPMTGPTETQPGTPGEEQPDNPGYGRRLADDARAPFAGFALGLDAQQRDLPPFMAAIESRARALAAQPYAPESPYHHCYYSVVEVAHENDPTQIGRQTLALTICIGCHRPEVIELKGTWTLDQVRGTETGIAQHVPPRHDHPAEAERLHFPAVRDPRPAEPVLPRTVDERRPYPNPPGQPEPREGGNPPYNPLAGLRVTGYSSEPGYQPT